MLQQMELFHSFNVWIIFHFIYTPPTHIFFICSSVDGHFGCFQVLGIVNSATMNIWVHVSFWMLVFSGYTPGSGITGPYGSFVVVSSLSCVRLFCDPMDCSLPGSSVRGIFPGKNTGVDCHVLLQGIFPTQELNQGFLHCRQILYQLSYEGSP